MFICLSISMGTTSFSTSWKTESPSTNHVLSIPSLARSSCFHCRSMPGEYCSTDICWSHGPAVALATILGGVGRPGDTRGGTRKAWGNEDSLHTHKPHKKCNTFSLWKTPQ